MPSCWGREPCWARVGREFRLRITRRRYGQGPLRPRRECARPAHARRGHSTACQGTGARVRASPAARGKRSARRGRGRSRRTSAHSRAGTRITRTLLLPALSAPAGADQYRRPIPEYARPPARRHRSGVGAQSCLQLRSSDVMSALVVYMAGRLKLQRAVIDVEVAGEAVEELVEQPAVRIASSTTTCADTTGTPDVIIQACRSCTSRTPGASSRCRRTSSRSTPRGVASSSTSTASRSRCRVRGTISAAMASEAIASARVNPVSASTPAATSTASPFPTAATSPTTTMIVVPTGSGWINRNTAWYPTYPARPSRSRPLTRAAMISARWYPKVRCGVVGRPPIQTANSARPIPTASPARWPASASSARLPDSTAPTTSATRTATVIASTAASRRRCRPAAVTPCLCLCTRRTVQRDSPGCALLRGWVPTPRYSPPRTAVHPDPWRSVHLKSLTVKGFKSFASATTLKLEHGITSVVGPNGSGKSNVVDAIAWVLGEQGAKALRGGKMEDVIFAGTAGRAPLGRAEVMLTIDNTDGALPIDYTEVSITRRMFRSGESEYEINGSSCRLLDIQELLSDSGIGREMHVIVGQGQLDTVLHAKPEDRRAFIEEAAGVLKHRKRKEKALRKLEAMQTNLNRLTDLTAELRRQLKPLGKQAEVARRAAGIQADLRDARLRLLADDLTTLREALDKEIADETALRERRVRVEAEAAEVGERLAELEAALAEDAPVLTAAQETWYALSALQERFRSTHQLATERLRHLTTDSEEERPGRDPDHLAAEAEKIREQEAGLRAELQTAQAKLAEAVERRQGLV